MGNRKFLLSVIAYLDTAETAEKFLQSIAKNKCFDQTEIIFVTNQDETSEDVAAIKEYQNNYPQMRILFGLGESIASCYNAGKAEACGEWLHFTYSSSYYNDSAFDCLLANAEKTYAYKKDIKGNIYCEECDNENALKTPDLICMTPFVPGAEPEIFAPYTMRAKKIGFVYVEYNTQSINLMLSSFIIKAEKAQTIDFNDNLECESETEYLLKLFLQNRVLYYEPESSVFSGRKAENSYLSYDLANAKQWYTQSVLNCYIPLLKNAQEEYGSVPLFLQIAIYYLIFMKYENNYFERDTGTLSREEAFEFDDSCASAFEYIDDKVIFSNYKVSYIVTRQFKMHAYHAKYKGASPYSYRIFGSQMYLVNEKQTYTIDDFQPNGKGAVDYAKLPGVVFLGKTFNQEVAVQVINFVDGKIEIDLRFNDEFWRDSDYQIYAVTQDREYNGQAIIEQPQEKYELTDSEIYSSYKYFGITATKFKMLHLSIEPEKLMNKKLIFAVEYQGLCYALNIKYLRAYSRLAEKPHNYWMFDKHRMARPDKRSILFENCSSFRHFEMEIIFLLYNLFFNKDYRFKVRVYNFLVRLVADILRPVHKKKHIWLTFDKLYKAGDNGEYMFRYCNEQHDGIHPYYIISKTSLDYPRLKKEFGKKILVHESFRQRVLALNSEMILATHATVMRYCGFNNPLQPMFKNMFNATIMCIQHGLTIQKIAQYQSRVYDNTRLYGLASKYEWENICNKTYGFTEKELRLTGLARYDGLKNRDQRQILITPTWRRNVVTPGIAFVKKAHNDSFKKTTYYKIYNGLINDETLIECAKRNNYKIIFLLHPAMSSQMDDYVKNDYVDIVQATGDMNYEKILTESSLMVTDYSGVQFDFAYQRKPVVYYHPQLLPPQYETGKLDFETMGFGPICVNHDQIINTLCDYMNNECKNSEEYIKRADDFFEYDDFDNCRRIYDQARNFIKIDLEKNNNNINY